MYSWQYISACPSESIGLIYDSSVIDNGPPTDLPRDNSHTVYQWFIRTRETTDIVEGGLWDRFWKATMIVYNYIEVGVEGD